MESFEQVLTSTLVGFRLEAFEPSPQGKEPHERRLLGDASLRMVSIRPAIRDLTAGAKRPTPRKSTNHFGVAPGRIESKEDDMTAEHLGIARFKASKEHHDDVERGVRKFLDYEVAHPDTYHYSSTRYYTMDDPEDPAKEYWMFIDRFEDYDDYVTSLANAISNPDNAEGQRLMAESLTFSEGFFVNGKPVVEGGPTQIEHWVEVSSLRVDNQGH